MVVQFRDISREMLRDRELLSYVCAGFYRAGLLQKLIPPSRWHIETLHLILNTGNCWFEVARKVLQYRSRLMAMPRALCATQLL
jgi:hypothetical protein